MEYVHSLAFEQCLDNCLKGTQLYPQSRIQLFQQWKECQNLWIQSKDELNNIIFYLNVLLWPCDFLLVQLFLYPKFYKRPFGVEEMYFSTNSGLKVNALFDPVFLTLLLRCLPCSLSSRASWLISFALSKSCPLSGSVILSRKEKVGFCSSRGRRREGCQAEPSRREEQVDRAEQSTEPAWNYTVKKDKGKNNDVGAVTGSLSRGTQRVKSEEIHVTI